MIFCFSGTGNSLHTARRISEITGDDIIMLNDVIRDDAAVYAQKEKRLIFTAPVYAWRLPVIVSRWIMGTEFSHDAETYFVLTCGSEAGDAARYAEELCMKKHLRFMGCASVIMPENYIALFDAPGKDEAVRIVSAASERTDMLADRISKGMHLEREKITFADRIRSTAVNPLFYRLIVKDRRFRSDERCISCGLCEKVCPLRNINMAGGRPRWNGSCTHCMACITSCPQGAIEYGRASEGKPRYRCPEI